MQFEVPGKPQGKQRARVSIRGGYARAYTPEETASYENLVKLCYRQEAMAQGASIITRDKSVWIDIDAKYEIPKSFSKKKRDEALTGVLYPHTKPDIDNVVKIICDALNGVAFIDDSQVVSVQATKRYANAPSVTVTIHSF